MARITGFPEWLPQQELIQQDLIARVREAFELHGFAPLQTRSVELLEDLLSQGDTDKEIYGVTRLAGEPAPAEWGLHYDLTVPFARFVSESRSKLTFPFRRYQIQQAWRGERPQLGRFREFIQADADVIDEGVLDLRHDADLLSLLARATSDLPVPTIRLLVNNRKVLQGFYLGLGISDVVGALRAVDKLPKIGDQGVKEQLIELGHSTGQAEASVGLTKIAASDSVGLEAVRDLGVEHPLLDEGLTELGFVLDRVQTTAQRDTVVAALHIARGFDYYTGTVAEGVFADHPDLGSVCSGGRYDTLASGGSTPLPGVGVSIGISRIMAFCDHLELLKSERRTPAEVMVIVHSEAERNEADVVADRLRGHGVKTLVSDSTAAYGKQIKRADRLGIRYVWFPGQNSQPDEVRDIRSGTQAAADADVWRPATG